MGGLLVRCGLGRRLLPFALAVSLVAPALAEATTKKVLLLNSYHQGYKWTDDETRGVLAAFGHTKNVQVYVEYMGTKWSSDQAYFRQLRDVYQSKFGKIPLDVIVATDNDAFDFLRRYRDEVFGKLPAVFCGVNFFQMEDLAGYDLFTGLNETAEFKENIDLILRLHPSTKTIVFVTDTSITGRKTHDLFMQAIPEYRGRLDFQFLEDVTMNDLLETVAHLPDGSVVLHTFFFKDKAGRIFEYDEGIELISAVSRVPVYGAWDFSLGHGIVGGYLTNGFDQGRIAGEMAARVLTGERVEDIPPVMKSPARVMFDQRQMDRWGIKRADLPWNAFVVNAPPSFYAVNKGLVWGGASGFMGLCGAVAVLLVNIGRRRQAEKALRESERLLAHEAEAQRFLSSVSGQLAASLDLETTGRTVSRLVVPRFVEAALLCIAREGDDGPRLWYADVDPERERKALPELQTALPSIRSHACVSRALESGRPVVSPFEQPWAWPADLFEAGRFSGDATFPLLAGSRSLGTLTLLLSDRSRFQPAQDLALVEELAHRSAIALENASLFNSAEDAVQARDEFLAVASHELKTPLTPLRLNIQSLQRLIAHGEAGKLSETGLEGVLRRADGHIRRLVGLVDDMLDVSRITTRRLRLDLEPVDLGAVVRDVLERHQGGLSQAGCSVSMAIAPDVVGRWDRFRVEQVLSNLLTNAMKYAPGPLEVCVEVDEGTARLVVCDHGPGIATRDQERIFLPFERAVSYMKLSGFGLGLYIVRQIVDAHGGVVHLDSAPGRGSTFIVELPRQPPAPV